MARARFLLALLLAVGSAPLGAQVRPDSVRRDSVKVAVPVPDRLRDSLRADSIRRAAPTGARVGATVVQPDSATVARERDRRDSLFAARMRDTIKAPMTRFEEPRSTEITDRLRFSREQILSSGAVNLADILDRVPGITSFRTGWVGGAHAAAFRGDFRRIRFFLDGVELDAIGAREGGVLDLGDVPLWTLDELVVERGAGEVRIWMRSWSRNSTTPYTRADIFTGDLNTNGFRALLARRYRNGLIIQFAGQQAATQTGRVSAFGSDDAQRGAGDGTNQTANVRIGWARGLLSADVYATNVSRDRDPMTAREGYLDMPAFKGSRREAFLRVGYGDTTRGFWSQAVVGLLRTRLQGIRTVDSLGDPGDDSVSLEPTDTVRGRTQQMLAVGYRAPLWALSFVNRMRPINGTVYHAPAVRGSFGTSRYLVGGYAEQNGADSTRRLDGYARVQPLPWLAGTIFASSRTPTTSETTQAGLPRIGDESVRAEAAVRFRGAWLGAGFVRAGAMYHESPVLFGGPGARLTAFSSSGVTASATGPLYKDVRVDVQAIRWEAAQFGRPRLHVRTEVALVSNWLRRFPKGEFGIDARLVHDLRDPVLFYYGFTEDDVADTRLVDPVSLFSAQLEIRIQRATLFYQYRNLTGKAYEQVPGLTMPFAVQMYGVRWEFFN